MILGACFYATVVGSVAMLVKNADVQTSIYHEHMDALNSKMELMGLSQDLRQRVVSYYAFVWKRLRTFSTERGEFQLNVENFLQELPLPLAPIGARSSARPEAEQQDVPTDPRRVSQTLGRERARDPKASIQTESP